MGKAATTTSRPPRGGLDESETPAKQGKNEYDTFAELCKAEYGIECLVEPETLADLQRDGPDNQYIDLLHWETGSLRGNDYLAIGVTSHKPTKALPYAQQFSVTTRAKRQSIPAESMASPEIWAALMDALRAFNAQLAATKRPITVPDSVLRHWKDSGMGKEQIDAMSVVWAETAPA